MLILELVCFFSGTIDGAKVDFGLHSTYTIIFLSTIYIILSLSAFSGNSIVIWIISKYLDIDASNFFIWIFNVRQMNFFIPILLYKLFHSVLDQIISR